MPARYYTKVFKGGGATVRVVFIDTTPLIDKYRDKSDTYPDAATQDADAQLQWLDKTLADATEDWIIVAGHHPIYAYTDKEDSERADMQKKVDTILRKHKVDMYLCGHIHNFQHIRRSDSPIDYIVNSSGSLARNISPRKDIVFSNESPGFSLIHANRDSLNLHMVDRHGDIIHTVTRHRQ